MGGVAHPPFHSYPSRTSNFECCLPWCQWLEVVVSIVTWSSTLKTTGCQNWQGHVINWLGFGNCLTLARLGRAERAEVPIKPVIIPGGEFIAISQAMQKAWPVYYNLPLLWLLAPTGALVVAPIPLFHITFSHNLLSEESSRSSNLYITSSCSSKILSMYACIFNCIVD